MRKALETVFPDIDIPRPRYALRVSFAGARGDVVLSVAGLFLSGCLLKTGLTSQISPEWMATTRAQATAECRAQLSSWNIPTIPQYVEGCASTKILKNAEDSERSSKNFIIGTAGIASFASLARLAFAGLHRTRREEKPQSAATVPALSTRPS